MSSSSGYLKPHPALAELVSDPTPSFMLSPRNEYCLLYDVPTHLSLEDVSREEVRVAGLRFNGPLRSASRVRWSSWAKIRSMKRILDNGRTDENADVSINVPPGTRMRMFDFRKDNSFVAFLVDGKTNTELWVAEVKTGQAKRVATHLNAVLIRPFQWRSNKLLVVVVPPSARGDPPKPRAIPDGPIIKEHFGKAAPARTYHDLLNSEFDELVFEHYATSQLAICDPVSGKQELIADGPALYSCVEISPDCRYLLLHAITKPYSRALPAPRFSKDIYILELSTTIEQWTQDKTITILPFAYVACQEDLSTSFDARTRGPRCMEFAWNEPHTVVYVQSLDDGEPTNSADEEGNRDAIYFVKDRPFNDLSNHRKIFAGPLRVDRLMWSNGGECLVEESWYKTRQENMYVIIAPKNDNSMWEKRVLYSRSSDDAYSSWGSPRVEFVQDTGNWRLKCRPTDGAVLFIGEGASPNGSRPFADYVDMKSGNRERVWRSPPVLEPKIPEDPSLEVGEHAPVASQRRGVYERPVDFIWRDTDPLRLKQSWVIIASESPESPPNVVIRSLDQEKKEIAITTFPNPQPSLLGVKKELIRYSRADGVELSASLLLPSGYDGKTRLPLLCWAYPTEFKNKEHASQIKTSPYRFDHTSWSQPTLWLARGWAILDDFSVPIVGVGDAEPNDTFIEQLVSSAEAAVKECVNRGVADPNRVAV